MQQRLYLSDLTAMLSNLFKHSGGSQKNNNIQNGNQQSEFKSHMIAGFKVEKLGGKSVEYTTARRTNRQRQTQKYTVSYLAQKTG